MLDVNLGGTRAALELARTLPDFRRFVLVSTGSVYGDEGPTDRLLPEVGHVDPTTLYGISKQAAEMVARDPNARKFAGGMPGGPDNPLGARALYLYQGDQDTIYRIHGTPEPWSIGLNVSSGCIRMNNEDIVDLHSQIEVGAKVIVLMQGASLYKGV